MRISSRIQRSFKGQGQLFVTAENPAIDVHYRLELSGVLTESDALGGRERLPDWRDAKGELTLRSQDDEPLDRKIEYLLTLDGDFVCRIKVRPHGKPLTYHVEGSVIKQP